MEVPPRFHNESKPLLLILIKYCKLLFQIRVFFRFISVFGVGYQSKLTRDVIPSYINIQLVIHPIETTYLNQHHPTCASLSQAWMDQENRNRETKPKKRRRGVPSARNQSTSSSVSSKSPETGIDLQDRP